MSSQNHDCVHWNPAEASTLVDLLRWRAEHQSAQQALTFLVSEDLGTTVSYAELDRRARAIAVYLQAQHATGERVLLVYPPGLEYIAAFFGCLYAGAIAVPVYPPRRNRPSPRLAAAVQDSRAAFVLTDSATFADAARLCVHTPELAPLRWVATDTLTQEEAVHWEPPPLAPDSYAFLQYTSGSTSTPKGVILSHENLLQNSKLIQGAFQTTTESRGVIWLPPYHDMGLIGGILQPIYTGFPVVLMAPMAFLQQPYFWLKTVSTYKATSSGGPNFAYELCVEKITAAQRETLDLSHWEVAFNGAEPIRRETLDKFADTFAACGFRREAFYPCYGLAEGTLIVSGGITAEAPVVQWVESEPLTRNQVAVSEESDSASQPLISSGRALGDQQIVIADPHTLAACAPNEIGEIWVSGSSVAQGYWGQPDISERTFRARLTSGDDTPFLRTGDLGFMQQGELFVTGRLKDLIIIRGRNYYPQDIELTVENSHPALRPGNGAVFTIEIEGEEQLVVAQEIHSHARHTLDSDAVATAVRHAVAEQYELQVYAVLLLRTGSMPKTSSGKIQRHACRRDWLAGTLSLVGESSRADTAPTAAATMVDENSLIGQLQQAIAPIVRLAPAQIEPNQPLHRLGLDSLAAVALVQQLESRWQYSISMVELLEGVSLTELATAIEQTPRHAQQSVIATVPREAVPLSATQQRLWFLERLAGGNVAYHIPAAVAIRGTLDVAALRDSINAIIHRHESLRTTFHTTAGKPYQRIGDAQAIDLPVIALESEGSDADWLATVHDYAVAENRKPFDLSRDLLLRATLLRRHADEHVLLLTFHHIITDGWSMVLFAREVRALYQAQTQGQPISLALLEAHYADVAAHQSQRLERAEVIEPLRHYWAEQLAGMPPLLPLPTDHPRPEAQTFNGAQLLFSVSPALRSQLQQVAVGQDATLFMTLFAALNLLFRELTHRDDMVIGTSVANRTLRESHPLIGLFVNQLVLRTSLAGATTFQELLRRVRHTTLNAFKHQEFPFDKLVDLLRVERSPRYNPLFQSNFVFENTPLDALTFDTLQLALLDIDSGAAPFDLSLLMSEDGAGLKGIFRYNRDLFERDTIERWAARYQAILEAVAADPAIALADLRPVGAHAILLSPPTEIPATTIPARFTAQAQRTPHAVAALSQGVQLTFAELEAQANQLAHHLVGMGVGAEVRVAFCLTRSVQQLVVLLGILKAGGAYVALDPTYPAARFRYILEDAAPQVVITESALQSIVPESAATLLCIDEAHEALSRYPTTPPRVKLDPANVAYILHTSGSTGNPKGVMVYHRSVVNLVNALHERVYAAWGEGLRVSLNAPLVFDGSVKQWVQLLNGHTLCIVPDTVRSDAAKLVQWATQNQLDVLDCTPSHLKRLLTAGLLNTPSLKGLLIGGEALDSSTWTTLAQSETVSAVNVYGPTEATVDTTACHVRHAPNHPTIGHPLLNVNVYLLDAHQQPIADGDSGELYVGGAGVARGYWGNPALTAERFLPDPFSGEVGARMYRTGDVARWRDTTGGLDYIGRTDHQVQVQGARVELGEVEATLNNHPAVAMAAVLVRETTPGDAHLVAYVMLKTPSADALAQLRADVRQQLPLFMIPRHFHLLDSMPFTASGKIDKQTLLTTTVTPTPVAAPTAYSAPRNEMERKIVTIWQEVLGIDKVGLHDNFWDLGGHSLLLVQAYDRLQELSGKPFPMVEMYRHATVSALAQFLAAGQGAEAATLAAEVVDERVKKQKEALERQRRLASKRSGQR